ncbi:MAG TPA: hypothetical protein VL996_14800, partial [Methylocella sp.]|nr:hypothetical protein [Methylocella sp.]
MKQGWQAAPDSFGVHSQIRKPFIFKGSILFWSYPKKSVSGCVARVCAGSVGVLTKCDFDPRMQFQRIDFTRAAPFSHTPRGADGTRGLAQKKICWD